MYKLQMLKLPGKLKVVLFNLFVFSILGLYLLPLGYMAMTAAMPTEQLGDRNAPLFPAKIKQFNYQGKDYQIMNVPTEEGVQPLALINIGQTQSEFIDPENTAAGLIPWQGDWRQLKGVYEFAPEWGNFTILIERLPFGSMLWNTFVITIIGEIGILFSSILVAYGFARFSLPGGNFLFYLLIATILIPEKITLIPTYYYFTNLLKWRDTLYPILLPLFFGNAIYIFLLRQNFKSIPIELEEAAMLDGAGPIRRLFSIILPQSWPVITTVSLLHFFYTWNETRQAALYLSSSSTFMPVSFGIQNYQSLVRIDNVIQAGTIVVLVIPFLVLLLSQKSFMQGLVITGMEEK